MPSDGTWGTLAAKGEMSDEDTLLRVPWKEISYNEHDGHYYYEGELSRCGLMED